MASSSVKQFKKIEQNLSKMEKQQNSSSLDLHNFEQVSSDLDSECLYRSAMDLRVKRKHWFAVLGQINCRKWLVKLKVT